MPVVVISVIIVAGHGKDVGVHVGWHALGVLHHTAPVQFRRPSRLTGEATTTWTGICVHS